ncbi:hypothetical protein ACQI4E_29440 [Streptomyces sp. CA-252508]|uniref:hypothetical protein n=1 Tax=Streptomyces sp. CA-252508 TaxID=3418946 RepID=UPI003D8D95EC
MDRGSIIRRAQEIRYHGITRTLSYSVVDGGAYDKEGLFLHQVRGGTFTFLGQYARSRLIKG